MTEDQAALRQIMRLRGYSLMTNVLEDYATDMELITLVGTTICLGLTQMKLIITAGAAMYDNMAIT